MNFLYDCVSTQEFIFNILDIKLEQNKWKNFTLHQTYISSKSSVIKPLTSTDAMVLSYIDLITDSSLLRIPSFELIYNEYRLKIASVVPDMGWKQNWASDITWFSQDHFNNLEFRIDENIVPRLLGQTDISDAGVLRVRSGGPVGCRCNDEKWPL